MSTKSKSTLSETYNNKASPATPKVSKLGRGVAKSDADSPSPLQNPRAPVDKSPRSVPSKPTTERRSPRHSTPPDKQPVRVLKGSELQAQLNIAQDDLKKAQEKLVLVEKQKAREIEELKEAQRLAEEANEKLKEALVAQKRAEEISEIEKFRAVEMEQAGIEAAKKKEEEWQKELEDVRNQHALDVATLLSATEELQMVKHELAMTFDAKNQALRHADDATKIAEIHAEKVEILTADVVQLKSSLDYRLEMEANDNRLVSELKSEIEILKQQLEKAKSFEEKLMDKEASLEQVNVELEAAKLAESYAHNLMEEWKRRMEELEDRAQEANRLEKSASDSLQSVMKQLKGSTDLLHDAESEIASLEEKVVFLEISIGKQKGDLEETKDHLDMAKKEASEMSKKVESLESEIETVKVEKSQALNNEQLAAANVQTLLEEKNKLINELETSREEEEKSKKAMESLASALHEVASEAREAKEKLVSSQSQNERYETQIEDLKLVLESTNKKYESMLDDAKREIDILVNSIEQSKNEHQNYKIEWEQRELHLMGCVKNSEEENSSKEKEVGRLVNSLKKAEEEASAMKEERVQLKNMLNEAESEVTSLKEILAETKAESMRLKESFLDKENEVQLIIQENEELRSKEAAFLKKAEELSKLLEEAMSRKQVDENGELTGSEKDYDMLPKVVEFSEQNGDDREKKPNTDFQFQQRKQPVKESLAKGDNAMNDGTVQMGSEVENVQGKPKENDNKVKDADDSAEVEFKMWESCKIVEKDFSPEREKEQESFEEEVDLKSESNESHDQINGSSTAENLDNSENSSSKKQNQKKKKPLLHKFGSLLKKKGTSNQK